MHAEDGLLNATVVIAWPDRAQIVCVRVPAGSTLRDAIEASGLFPAKNWGGKPPTVGVFGQVRALESAVGEGDRIEIYRPLTINPKEARRLRAALTARRAAR
jgi:putative ubiquitin-RnfH superfamily antitoxin RatB of RatAB toxin-antitoxin module